MPHLLNLEEFAQIVAELKEDLQREANQWVLKKDVHQAASSLAAIDAVDRLSHRVSARAFHLGQQEEPHVKLFHRRTKKQMQEAREQEARRGNVREMKKAAGDER